MTAPPTTDSSAFRRALDGQYALDREIGRGGMGIVYLARDLKLDRLVAVKTLPPQLAGDATLLFYQTEEAQHGRDAYKNKERPDFSQFPKRS